ncbi:MAG: hypothetical protein H7A21_14330 [Spirochaetales bacterium]|nr:hypothetical protein [Leptospiraceae bacterium]MCP5482609.1 hypothetical protein [Spirochaetales bacterium]MCP5485198.1 hypothetical protein [Spirochaetales bacterium]
MIAPRIGILIQARSNSTRLPGKIYLGLPENGDRAQIEHVYRRMLRVPGVAIVSLIVPENDLRLIQWCRIHRVEHFVGSELDVRERYRAATRHYGLDVVVRATGDNPCVDPVLAGEAVAAMRSGEYDLFSFCNLPLGCAVEVFQSAALMSELVAARPEHREHVSLHIKHNADIFRVSHPTHALGSNRLAPGTPRVTVDTAEDLSVVRALFSRLGPDFGVREILSLYEREPELFSTNALVEQRVFAKR